MDKDSVYLHKTVALLPSISIAFQKRSGVHPDLTKIRDHAENKMTKNTTIIDSLDKIQIKISLKQGLEIISGENRNPHLTRTLASAMLKQIEHEDRQIQALCNDSYIENDDILF